MLYVVGRGDAIPNIDRHIKGNRSIDQIRQPPRKERLHVSRQVSVKGREVLLHVRKEWSNFS